MLFARVLALSTRRGKDTLWALLGAVGRGFVHRRLDFSVRHGDGDQSFSGFGLFLDALLNLAVCRFILPGPLKHVVLTQREPA
jgi:hypothetical protein